jgi:hypothetical protein
MIKPRQIKMKVQEYLDNNIPGDDLIRCIDDAVFTDSVYEYSDCLRDMILRYQDILALYVSDPIKRSESSAYYGPEKLRVVVTDFRKELDTFDLSAEGAKAR